MVYIIFTNEGERVFDTLGALLNAAELEAESAMHRRDESQEAAMAAFFNARYKVSTFYSPWNGHTIHFEEGLSKKKYTFYDNGKDMYFGKDGCRLKKMIPRFILEPMS